MSEDDSPIDLAMARIARALQQEVGGVFGITHRDIEAALERMQDGSAVTDRLGTRVERVADLLDAAYRQARAAAEAEDYAALAAIIEMLEAYRSRVRQLVE